jgi:hypothetical protein
MDGFELVVRNGHADERIDRLLFVQEALPVGEQVADALLAFGRGVYDRARGRVGEGGAGYFADRHIDAFDMGADGSGGTRDEWPPECVMSASRRRPTTRFQPGMAAM